MPEGRYPPQYPNSRKPRDRMSGLLKPLSVLLPLFYALVWANYALLFFRDDPIARRTATKTLLATAGLHMAGLFLHAGMVRRCPMGNLPEILSVLSLSIVGVYLWLEHRQGNKYTGVFLLAIVVPLMVVSSSLTPPPGPASKLLKSPLFGVHTLMALLGYSAFAVGAVYGVMYLLMHRALKRQAFGLIFQRLPSLEGLAAMTVSAAVIGFLALTVTIGVGMLWGSNAVSDNLLKGRFWGDPKIYLTVLVWAVYGLGILVRFGLKWSNHHSVLVFLTAFAVAVCAAVALNTVVHTFHNFSKPGSVLGSAEPGRGSVDER
jgi:HemX protein